MFDVNHIPTRSYVSHIGPYFFFLQSDPGIRQHHQVMIGQAK